MGGPRRRVASGLGLVRPAPADAGRLRHLRRHTRRSAGALRSGTSEHFGPGVYRSDDLGRSWTEEPGAAVAFPSDLGSSVERVWQIQPGGADEPDVVYAGTQPSALFRSEDRGRSFSLVRSLWDHPHREQWGEGFGGQAIHSVLPHPTDKGRVTVAMSTGGVYRTEDRGASWSSGQQGNQGVLLPRPVARVRPVRAQDRRPSDAARPDLRPEPPWRLPHRRRRRPLGVDRRRSAGRLRLPDRGASTSTRHRLRVPTDGRRRTDPAERRGPGLALRRRGPDLGAVPVGAARPLLRRCDARRDDH